MSAQPEPLSEDLSTSTSYSQDATPIRGHQTRKKKRDEQAKVSSVKKKSSRQLERDARADELRKLSYDEYLKTPYWQQRRFFALKNADHRCQVCYGGDRELHIHHRTYERLGKEKASDLLVLCSTCHELFHRHGKLTKGTSGRVGSTPQSITVEMEVSGKKYQGTLHLTDKP